MAQKWVCVTCLISNDIADKSCSCCGTLKEPAGDNDTHPMKNLLPVKEQKVTTYLDDYTRIRQTYSPGDLKHTTVFVVGSSEVDQLPFSCCDKTRKPGTNDLESMYECSMPTPILTLPRMRVVIVSCGALHTALVTSSGSVYTFGCNDMGALGRKPNGDPSLGPVDSEPTLVEIKYPVVKATCGDNHTLFLTYMGAVYFSGSFKDTDGAIGVADYLSYDSLKRLDYVSTPVQVPCEVEGSTSISDISSGENHCVLLCQGGSSMYTFGSNEFSQLLLWEDSQVQNPTEKDVDLTVESNKKLLLTWPQHRTLFQVLNTSKDKEPEDEEKKEKPVRTRGNKRGRSNEDLINQVFTGNCTTFFQTKSLRVYGAGRNAQGEVGVGSEEFIVKQPRELTFFRGVELSYLSGGQFFTMALVNNYVFTWGKVDYLGLPSDMNHTNNNSHTTYRLEDLLNKQSEYEGESMPEKKRKVEETGNELDNLDVMESLLLLDYGNKYKSAVKLGKATSPVLVNFQEPVRTVFHGSDTLFALTFGGEMYSWGSAQNYALANGKDYFYQRTPELVPREHFAFCKVDQGSGGSQHTVFLAIKKRSNKYNKY